VDDARRDHFKKLNIDDGLISEVISESECSGHHIDILLFIWYSLLYDNVVPVCITPDKNA
jgi:hypothetical protein